MIKRDQITHDANLYAVESVSEALTIATNLLKGMDIEKCTNAELFALAALVLHQKNLEERALLNEMFDSIIASDGEYD
jgi:hypothetical protein